MHQYFVYKVMIMYATLDVSGLITLVLGNLSLNASALKDVLTSYP